MKKLTSFLCGLSIICTMTATACKEKPQESGKSEAIPVTPVVSQTMYKSEEFSLPEDYNGLITLDYSTEKGTALIYSTADYEYAVQYYDENLSPTEKFKLCKGKIEYGTRAFMSADGTIHLLLIYGEYDGDASATPEKYYANAEPKLEIYSYNPSGEEIGFIMVEDIPPSFSLMESVDDLIFYNGNYILTGFNSNYVIDKNGVVSEKPKVNMVQYAIDTEGRLVASAWDNYCFTDETLKYSENPTEFGEYIRRMGEIFTGTGDYSLFGVMQQGIYGITADGQVVKLLDFVSSRIIGNDIYDVAYVGEGKFAAISSNDMGNVSFMLFTVRPDGYVETREKVIVAYEGKNSMISENVATFNKASDEFEVEERIYEWGSDDLRADVLSDNSPDIYHYDDLDTVQSYTNIGAFADMYELMDKYGGLSREEIMPNVLEACEINDKLYFLTDIFSINCKVAYNEVLGREYSNWTLDEFFEYIKNMPEDMYIGDKWAFSSRYDLFCYLCQDNVGQWVDFDNNTCNFTDESFIKSLELTKKLKVRYEDFPSIYDTLTDDEIAAIEQENSALLKNKEALFGRAHMNNILVAGTAAMYGLSVDEATFVANPTKNGGGLIMGNDYFSVLSSGKCTEGAWEYLCWQLNEQNQEKLGNFSFPVRKDVFYKSCERRRDSSSSISASGGTEGYRFEYDATITQEQYDYIIGFIEKCNSLGGFRSKVRAILDDEYKAFEAGEISAEECAARIQSRMEIYLSENS